MGPKVFKRSYRWLGISFVLCLMIVAALYRTNTVGAVANPLDVSFGNGGQVVYETGGNSTLVEDVVVQPDGKIVVVGSADSSDPRAFTVSRFNPNGSPDNSFSGDGRVSGSFYNTTDYTSSSGYAVALQSDGKIVVAGDGYILPRQAFGVARFNPDGSYDTSFDGDGRATINLGPEHASVYGIAIQPDGKIVLAGHTQISTNYHPALARLNPDGSPDTTFSEDGVITTISDIFGICRKLLLQPDGKINIVVDLIGYGGLDVLIARYNPDGSPDNSFNSSGRLFARAFADDLVSVADAAIQRDGKIIIGATKDIGSDSSDLGLVRFNQNGSRDTSFDSDGVATVSFGNLLDIFGALTIQPDGRIVVAGGTHNAVPQNNAEMALARLNANGSLDSSFGVNGKLVTPIGSGNDVARALAVHQSGKIALAGHAGTPPLNTRNSGVLMSFMGDVNTADFDGDTRTDISIFRPSNGEWWYQKSSDGGHGAVQWGNSADKLAPGDFTGDGKTDIAIWRPSTGEWFILRSETVSYYAFPFGTTGDVPVPSDFDGDGRVDVGVFRPSDQIWYILPSSGGIRIEQFGSAGDIPTVGDYDGDGKSDIAVYSPNIGQWRVKRSRDNSTYSVTFGSALDKPVQGDYSGDGTTDMALFRPATGEWLILRSENFSFYAVRFGLSDDLPAPGDYDGDGKSDPAVFRPATNMWYVDRSTAGILITGFGANGDIPVPSAFVY